MRTPVLRLTKCNCGHPVLALSVGDNGRPVRPYSEADITPESKEGHGKATRAECVERARDVLAVLRALGHDVEVYGFSEEERTALGVVGGST